MYLHSNMFLLIPEEEITEVNNYVKFTFQYVSINTKKSIMDEFNTLVFTFQYVSINTKKSIMDEFNTLVFTFQYVSINTKSSGVYNVLRIFIYIPICFY